MSEQEMQFEIMKSQEEVNALRQEVAEINKERKYWQHYRIQAAIAAMNGYQSAPIIPGCDPNPSQQEVARWSVQLADALVAELKKGGQNEQTNGSNS